MSLISHKHGTTKEQAKAALQREIARVPNGGAVTWNGFEFAASVGPFGTVLKAAGHVSDTAVVVTKSGGALGGKALTEGRKMLDRLFPGG